MCHGLANRIVIYGTTADSCEYILLLLHQYLRKEVTIMAFKSMKTYNDERYKGLFRLVDDNDSADVIILYRSYEDVLIADAHYIKSADYSGYVHCNGSGCPACSKDIRVQQKLFIPLYNLNTNEIEFFDRNIKFDNVLQQQVFAKYPNPSAYVFKIIRHGKSGSMDTTYEIRAIANNTFGTYDQILQKFNITLPEYYSEVIREMSNEQMSEALNDKESAPASNLPDYQIKPREASQIQVPEAAPSIPVPDMPMPETVEVDSAETIDEDVDF